MNRSNVCSGHGKCNERDSCVCQDGYYGKLCEFHNCSGIVYDDESVCSNGRRICTSPDYCRCESEYYGETCQHFMCYGISHHNFTVC